MPRKYFRRRRSRFLSWKNLAIILFVIPIFLIGNVIFCIASPSIYPAKNLTEITPLRSLPGLQLPEKWRILLISSVQFVEAPMNTKLTEDVSLNSLKEVEIHSSLEYRLTENATVTLSEALSLEYEGVSDLQASLDGVNVNFKVADYEGRKYYVVPELSLTKMDEVRKFVMSFRYEILSNSSSNVRIPLLFNENYAQYVNTPLSIMQVQENTTSDVSIYRVRFDLPFRRILVEQSGWKDAFVPPESIKLVDAKNQLYDFYEFEYPILQECTISGNVYTFETHFSEQNIANTPSLTLVPDQEIPILLALFLASPFYVYIISWLEKRKDSNDSNKKESQSKSGLIRRFLSIIVKLYSLPLMAIAYFGVSSGAIIPMFYYLFEIMNPAILVLVFAYPLIYSIVHYMWKGRI